MEEGEGEGEGASAPLGATAVVFLPDGSGLPLELGPPPGAAAAELLRRLQEALALPPAAGAALALWMGSELLEVQLQPRHRPLRLLRQWPELLLRFSQGSPAAIAHDEPCLQLRRNVFYPRGQELELQDERLLRLLVDEAQGRLLGGGCPLDPPPAAGLALAALSCRLRLGPFRPEQHSPAELRPLVPELLPWARSRGGLWGSLLRRGPRPPPPEQQLLEAFSRTPGAGASPAELLRSFLRGCHRLPGYGCAFFPGAIERPPGGLLPRGGLRPVTVAVGLEGVTIIDPRQKHVLLALRFPELCWELVGGGEGAADPPQLWLEFDGQHGGAPVNRLLRIFSPQAELMSALIECCIELGGAGPPPGPDQATPPDAEATPPDAEATPPRESELRPRLPRLRTIDYVQDGQELRRVKPPRRTVSFFGRGGGSSDPGAGRAAPEQG